MATRAPETSSARPQHRAVQGGNRHRTPALRRPTCPEEVVERLADLATRSQDLQDQINTLRAERDDLILHGLTLGLSSAQLAETAHLTGARVRAIADAAASSSARDRVAAAVARLAEHEPPVCTTYGALAAVVEIGSAKGVASSLATNPAVSSREGARVLLLKWASPALGGYMIPNDERSWQTQGEDTASRLERLREDGLATPVCSGDGQEWIVPFDRVCADPRRLSEIIG